MSSTLLSIAASPCGANSTSNRVASAFLKAYEAAHPQDEVVVLDLWAEDLPAFDATAVVAQGRLLQAKSHNEEEAAVWAEITALCNRFKAADKVLVACPMWNFHIPYRLKHYLDLLIQPGLTFEWSPESGYKGLVKDRPVQLILTRAGRYTPPSPVAFMDHQTSYLRFIFEFLGFTDIRVLTVEPTWFEGQQVAANQAEEGFVAARDAGRLF